MTQWQVKELQQKDGVLVEVLLEFLGLKMVHIKYQKILVIAISDIIIHRVNFVNGGFDGTE